MCFSVAFVSRLARDPNGIYDLLKESKTIHQHRRLLFERKNFLQIIKEDSYSLIIDK